MFKLRPWRCHACNTRFYAWLVPASLIWYAHCPRCGLYHLERISARHVAHGPLRRIKRMLGFSAYRCDPCRERFFSIRPYREILPLGSADRKKRKAENLAPAQAQPPQS